jgi:hypothetical protein
MLHTAGSGIVICAVLIIVRVGRILLRNPGVIIGTCTSTSSSS